MDGDVHDAQMPKPQLQQAAAMIILSNTTIIPARQCSTKQTASKLATSGIYLISYQQQRGGRRDGRKHHARSSPRARMALTSDASDASKRHSPSRETFILSYLISRIVS